MDKKHSLSVLFFMLILTGLIIIFGYIWLYDQEIVSRPAIPEHHLPNTLSKVLPPKEHTVGYTHLLYGKASLSDQEKQVLSKLIEGNRTVVNHREAYTIAMICMKHRLTWFEIKEMVTGEKVSSLGSSLSISCKSGGYTGFHFDNKGTLINAIAVESPYMLPPLESVSPGTPITLPPFPRNVDQGIVSKDLFEQHLSRLNAELKGKPVGSVLIMSPPDFSNISYDSANEAVCYTIFDVIDTPLKKVAPEYYTGLIDQLRQNKLTNANKTLAIYLLGKMKAQSTNSIETLIKLIDWKAIASDYGDKRWTLYPARDALLRIGEASVGPIVQDLPGETNALRRQLLCAVVSTFGRTNWTTAWQPKPAIEQLQQMRATEADGVRQHNIDAALDLLIDNKVDLNIGWSGYFEE